MRQRPIPISRFVGVLLLLISGTLSLACSHHGASRTSAESASGQGFVLRVFFLGLMAFVPSEDGQRMTVLLINARDGFEASDGTPIPTHRPLLVARAASCSGDCLGEAQEIADYLYQGAPMPDPKENRSQFLAAIQGGGGFQLDGHEISVRARNVRSVKASRPLEIVRGRCRGSRLPRNAFEREDFGWVAPIREFAPEAAEVDPEALAPRPPQGLLAARLTLTAGTVKSHRLVSKEGKVRSLFFKPLAAESPSSDFEQALTEWVVADIPIEGCEVTLAAEGFEGQGTKTMTLAPARCDGGGVLEVALINLGEDSFRLSEDADHKHRTAKAGSHFEIYYRLSKTRPPLRRQPVPHLADKEVLQINLAPSAEDTSELLPVLGLPYGRGTYSRPICPVAEFQQGVVE